MRWAKLPDACDAIHFLYIWNRITTRDSCSHGFQPERVVEFGGLEWALLELSLFRWFAWCSLEVHTSRLVGCLSDELDNQLHRL